MGMSEISSVGNAMASLRYAMNAGEEARYGKGAQQLLTSNDNQPVLRANDKSPNVGIESGAGIRGTTNSIVSKIEQGNAGNDLARKLGIGLFVDVTV